MDYIGLDDVQKLVDVHEHMQSEKVFIQEAEQIGNHLEEVLAQIKRESLPEGVDLEDADWADAGRTWFGVGQHNNCASSGSKKKAAAILKKSHKPVSLLTLSF